MVEKRRLGENLTDDIDVLSDVDLGVVSTHLSAAFLAGDRQSVAMAANLARSLYDSEGRTSARIRIRTLSTRPEVIAADQLALALSLSVQSIDPRELERYVIRADATDLTMCASPFKSKRAVRNANATALSSDLDVAPMVFSRLEKHTKMLSKLADESVDDEAWRYLAVLATSWWRWMVIAWAVSSPVR